MTREFSELNTEKVFWSSALIVLTVHVYDCLAS